MIKGSGERAQWINTWHLSQIPSWPRRSQAGWEPSTSALGAWGQVMDGKGTLTGWTSSGFSKRPCLSNEERKDCRGHMMSTSVFYMTPHEHICSYTYATHTHFSKRGKEDCGMVGYMGGKRGVFSEER